MSSQHCLWLGTRGPFNIKMSSYQYRDSLVKDKTVSRPSYLYHGNPITGKDGLYIETGPRIVALSLVTKWRAPLQYRVINNLNTLVCCIFVLWWSYYKFLVDYVIRLATFLFFRAVTLKGMSKIDLCQTTTKCEPCTWFDAFAQWNLARSRSFVHLFACAFVSFLVLPTHTPCLAREYCSNICILTTTIIIKPISFVLLHVAKTLQTWHILCLIYVFKGV